MNTLDEKITVFTTTYNRAHLLGNLYQSLLRQSGRNFCWLVVDDGSTDNTRELVESWRKDNEIEIQYLYKKNGGMHTGYNMAIDNITTRLGLPVDSDDYLVDDAIEILTRYWKKYGSDQCAGLMGLDMLEDGTVVGAPFPLGETVQMPFRFMCRKYPGDKKMLFHIPILRTTPPYPEFEGEKICPFTYRFFQIDDQYQFVGINEKLVVVEYQADGSTNTIKKQYLQSPRGFNEDRKILMVRDATFVHRFKNAIHYVSNCILLKEGNLFRDSPKKGMTFFALPFGAALNLYLRRINR